MLYDAAAIDGATGVRRFVHVTFPLLANLYLVCTLLSTIWTIGDFNTVYFVSGGAPAMSTECWRRSASAIPSTAASPRLGVAAVMSALPLMIPVVMLLMRRIQTQRGAAVSVAAASAARRCAGPATGCGGS